MNIIVDGFGGDKAPMEVINGVLLALYKYKDLKITLVGYEDKLNEILATKSFDKERLTVVNSTEVIDCNEAPIEALRTKKDSSLVVAFDKLKTGEYDGMVSAGSTGAVLGGAVLKLGRIANVARPALAPMLPTLTGGKVLIIDCGANMDSRPVNLCQFAVMGSEFMKTVEGIENPRVALLSVGTEDAKGNQLVLDTFPMMKKLPINFVGNMEARDTLSGKYDVVVTDGFSGNILLKSTEGAIKNLMHVIKGALLSSFMSKIGALIIKKPLKKTLKRYDYEAYGGSPLLGTKQLIVKSHGSSNARQILSSIEQIKNFSESKLLENLNSVMSKFKEYNVNETTQEVKTETQGETVTEKATETEQSADE